MRSCGRPSNVRPRLLSPILEVHQIPVQSSPCGPTSRLRNKTDEYILGWASALAQARGLLQTMVVHYCLEMRCR
ncbi:hypothetical protein GDO81_020674 [Engystomops pustulosus]|uniref:Uncharacterized protein n=1 Tax=Engystomops pustulosus TaxID=76066 RepID=A0AAV6ZE51_ENGPU|nr:hypothetical protein GDO81_020674 [Engystomops pustulosus]